MKCPFCGNDMEHGYIYGVQRIGFPWYPDGTKPLPYIPDFRAKKKGVICFGKKDFEPCKFDTLSMYVCRSCKKGIVDEFPEEKE